MSFESLADFLDMGGHALYVWLAYGSALAVIVGNLWAPVRARRRFFMIEGQRARRSTNGVHHAPPSS
jgi:heme exporter protein D